MFSWLTKCFPGAKKPRTEVITEMPSWSVADANQLHAFLESRAGHKMLDRMKHTVTAMCLDPRHFDEQMSADRRALALVINGIEHLADDEYWKYRDKEYLERAFAVSEFDPSSLGEEDDEEEFLAE